MSNDTTETPRTDALRHTDMWNTSGKLTESVKALIELCEALERENAALRRKLDEMREERDRGIARNDHLVKILLGIFSLCPPAPIEKDGRTFVFENPEANRHLRLLGDQIRAIPAKLAALSADGEMKEGEV